MQHVFCYSCGAYVEGLRTVRHQAHVGSSWLECWIVNQEVRGSYLSWGRRIVHDFCSTAYAKAKKMKSTTLHGHGSVSSELKRRLLCIRDLCFATLHVHVFISKCVTTFIIIIFVFQISGCQTAP